MNIQYIMKHISIEQNPIHSTQCKKKYIEPTAKTHLQHMQNPKYIQNTQQKQAHSTEHTAKTHILNTPKQKHSNTVKANILNTHIYRRQTRQNQYSKNIHIQQNTHKMQSGVSRMLMTFYSAILSFAKLQRLFCIIMRNYYIQVYH